MNRAIANTILERYKEAKEDFAHVVESCPFWAAVYFNRAHFYYCLKQYELAEEDLSQGILFYSFGGKSQWLVYLFLDNKRRKSPGLSVLVSLHKN